MKLTVLEGKPRITLTPSELETLSEKTKNFDDLDIGAVNSEVMMSASIAHSTDEIFSKIAPNNGIQMKYPDPDRNTYLFNLTDNGYAALKERGSITTDYFEIAVER